MKYSITPNESDLQIPKPKANLQNILAGNSTMLYVRSIDPEKRQARYTGNLTLAGVLTVSDRVGEDTPSNLLLHVPLGGTFGLPGPVHPAGTLLVSVELTLDKATKVGAVILGQSGHRPSRLASTAAKLRGTRERTVVAGTNTLAVEVLGTVGHGTSPFTNDGPLIRSLNVLTGEAANIANVGVDVLSEKAAVKHFVVVGIHHHKPETRVCTHESVPRFGGHESIMHDQCGVLASFTDDTPGVIVVLLKTILIDPAGDAGLV